ncbi:PREDICTED: uncharacterized protein LOC104703998 [Camelina sativa]|uniref:Uncharacterized protein LOC104703998 n=1 Tax=Camelina sativa TaxID=90675 RepID=A0ABM0SZJ7_CAMSA|nr:PREDICTED: uncharacterized protein LOC104703998 [Camelina sativa]
MSSSSSSVESPLVGNDVPTFSNTEAIERGMAYYPNIRAPWMLMFRVKPEERRDLEECLHEIEDRHTEYRDRLAASEQVQRELLLKLEMLESHPKDWIENGFDRIAALPPCLIAYCNECRRESDRKPTHVDPALIGDFIPGNVKPFYINKRSNDAELAEAETFFRQIEGAHQELSQDLQYFHMKRNRIDRQLKTLESKIAILKAKRKRTTDLLDESEQKARALETRPEDWEKTGLQLVWPMPKRLKTSVREIAANSALVRN